MIMNYDFDFYNCDYSDLCNGPLCPTPAPTIYFNGIHLGIYANNILECIFNVICNGKGFVCGKNIIVNDMNNENFYYNGYYGHYEYPTPTPAPTTNFNGIHTGLRGNNILKGVYGIDHSEYVFDNEISNRMIFGMFIFIFFKFCFFSLFFLSV